MDLSGFEKELREKGPRPAYLFTGDQDLLKRRALDALQKARGGGEVKRCVAGETPVSEIIDARSNLSLWEPLAVVVVRQAGKLLKADLEAFDAGLEADAEGPTIVFWDVKVKKTFSFFSKLSRSGAEVIFDPPTRAKAIAWVERRGKAMDAPLAPGVAELLVELLGSDLMRLETTLKTVSLAATGGPIDAETVARLVPEARVHALYELQDAISSKRPGAAVSLYRKAIDDGETPYALVGVLLAELRRLRLAREAPRGSRGDLAKRLGVPPFRVDKILSASRRFRPDRLAAALDSLAQIDIDLKTGRGEPASALEGWIVELTA